jgi:outer membrane receptor protein involved in Fe transport
VIVSLLAAVLTLASTGGVIGSSVSGTVRDNSGGVVQGAVVTVRQPGAPDRQLITDPDGRFTVEVPEGTELTIIVRAGGFAETVTHVTASESSGDLNLVVVPASVLETVTVTPARGEQKVADVPASVNILQSDQIRQSPAVVADDVLRQVPTFSLFRRTSSLSSHPTSQGVSLRGIGPSGVSRTLVVIDGAPFNDPFGGWVYWTRVPLEDVDRIEVVDGPSSNLYGNYAMGGVINIISGRPARRTIDIKPQYGNHNSPKLDLSGSDVWGKVGVLANASLFDTDGFPIVIESERGIIDNNATVKFQNYNLKLDYTPSDRLTAFVRGGYFTENRGNGKILEVNDTRWSTVSGGIRMRLPDESDLQASVFGDVEHFHSTFLAVTPPSRTIPPRSIVRLTVDQTVPTNAFGGSVQWSRAFGLSNFFNAGTDFRWVDGDSQEDSYNAVTGPVVPPVQGSILAIKRVSGGTQRSIGAFVQDVLTPVSRLAVTLSARVDGWRNYDAHNLEHNVPSGTPTPNNRLLPDRDDVVVSPKAAAVYHVTDRLNLWGTFSTGFRAPTLNELYRQFRVGTVLTLANEQLGPERLIGGELGINLIPIKNLNVRATYFDNQVNDPVSNVTISTSGSNVIQQRRNLGQARIRGLQADSEYRLSTFWRVSGGYLNNHATVEEYAANPALVGNYLPQVPKNRGSLQVTYANPKYVTASVGLQFVGRQFDDDQNARVVPGETEPGLPGYTLADLMVTRTIKRNFDVYLGVQNLFDTEYIVGTLPTTIGSPRLVSGGVRLRFSTGQ